MRTNTRTFPPAEITLQSHLAPVDLVVIFERDAPVEVDLGCGDGAFLSALAREFPERNFLGVERMVGRVRSTARKIGDAGLPHARILQADILDAVQHLLPPASVDVFYLMFPDPWPKRRHEPRRTFSAAFLRAVARALKHRGILRVATDDAPYFAAMQRISTDAGGLAIDPTDDAMLPTTTFEARFRATGLEIHRLSLRKI